jgi:hypothetical protein
MFAEEILSEIDSTLDQLIRNAESLQGAISYLSNPEIDAFQKTQESLLHHLLHLDQSFETKRKSLSIQNAKSAAIKLQEKYHRFEKLKVSVHKRLIRTQRFGNRHPGDLDSRQK